MSPDSSRSTPHPDLVIYDGDCGICQWSADFGTAQARGRLRYVPAQLADLDRYGISREDAAESVYFIRVSDGQVWKTAGAVFEQMKRMRFPFNVMGHIGALLPVRLLFEPVYRWVAANRTAISTRFGLTACVVEESP